MKPELAKLGERARDEGLDIGFVSLGFAPDVGGIETHLAQLAHEFLARGHRVHVLCIDSNRKTPPYTSRDELLAGVRVRRVAYRYHDHRALADLALRRAADDAVMAWLAEEPCDVVHVHHASAFGAGLLQSIHEMGRPLVLTLHDYWFLCPRGQMLRINVQVIHQQSRFNVWAAHYECSREDLEAGAGVLIETIVATAQTQIVLHEGANDKHFNDEHERIEHLASKAWAMLYRLTPESLGQAEKLCAAALSLDPNSARAHQALACVLHHQYYMGFTTEPERVIRLGLNHIDRAAEINEQDEYTHWVRGNILLDLRNTPSALAAFDRSREINPTFSLALASYGTACAWAGRCEDAIRLSEQALAANPKDPSNFFRFNTIAVAHFANGNFEQALEWSERVLERRKAFLIPHLIRVASSAHLGLSDLPVKAEQLIDEFPTALSISQALAPFTRPKDQESLRAGLEKALGNPLPGAQN